jgi:hypothetical protein
MWKYVTTEAECEHLYTEGSEVLIATRDASIPTESKTSADSAPEAGDPVITDNEEEDPGS